MAYKITLCNTIFDRENDNVLMFNSKNALINYINNIEDKVVIPDVNFDAKNIINTSIYVIVDTTELLKILNYNYAVVSNDDNTDVLFYFINESAQDSGNQIRLDMQIDVWNTYILDLMLSDRKCQGLIQKTHLNRYKKFADIPNGLEYTYNFDRYSPFFEREDLQNVAKRVVSKQKLVTLYDESGIDSDFNKWFEENLICWLYCYVPSDQQYNWYEVDGNQRTSELTQIEYKKGESDTRCGLTCICVPILKSNKKLKIMGRDTQTSFNWDVYAFREFLRANDGYARVYALKQSIMSPFYSKNMTSNDFVIDSNGDMNLKTIFQSVEKARFLNMEFLNTNSNDKNGVAVIEYQDLNKSQTMGIRQSFFTNRFTKNELKDIDPNIDPKVYNEDYSIYRVYFGGQEYNLPISKTNDPRPYFQYFETLTPDITKFYLSYDNDKGSNPLKNYEPVFTNFNVNDWSGLIGTLDLSLWYATNNLDSFLASNRNNLQIFQNQQESERTSAYLGIAKNTFNAGVGLGGSVGAEIALDKTGSMGFGAIGLASSLFGSGISLIGLESQQSFARENYNLTMDNMRQSPSKLSAVNSNSVLMQLVDDLGIYIELQQLIPFELQGLNESLRAFGYNYNRIADVKDFIKTRKYYNYIKALIFEIDGNISERVRDLIKGIFAKGVRVWHSDSFIGIDFNINNYERSLD